MPTLPFERLSGTRVDPIQAGHEARQRDVQLAASTLYAAGALLGEVAATPGTYGTYSAALIAAGAAAVPSEGAAGALLAGTYHVRYTYVDADGGESLPSPDATAVLGAAKRLHVAAVTPLPTGAVSVNWYISDAANSATVRFIANGSGAATDFNALPAGGAAVPPATGTAYVQGSTGLHIPRAVLPFPCVTDAAGAIWLGDTVGSAEVAGISLPAVPVWISGLFESADIPNLDTRAVSLLGHLVSGDVSNGLFVIHGP